MLILYSSLFSRLPSLCSRLSSRFSLVNPAARRLSRSELGSAAPLRGVKACQTISPRSRRLLIHSARSTDPPKCCKVRHFREGPLERPPSDPTYSRDATFHLTSLPFSAPGALPRRLRRASARQKCSLVSPLCSLFASPLLFSFLLARLGTILVSF